MGTVLRMAFVVGLLSVLGCEKDRDETKGPADTTAREQPGQGRASDDKTSEANPITATSQTVGAVATITKARCEREARCGNVGTDRDYSDLVTCQSKVREEWKQDLNALDCPGGVAEAELTECVMAIRNEDCSRPIEKLERIVACKTGDLCMASR